MAPKKKLTKKEKAKLEAEQVELMRVEMEKEKMRKIEEEKERKEREHAEAEKRQKQEITENKFRRQQLKETDEYFQIIEEKITKIYAEQKLQKEWEQYMRCNGLPNAGDPSDLRRYIHIWLKKIEDYNINEKNWLLKIIETSILTQDQNVVNLTMEHLRSQLANLGDIYSAQTKEVLGILDEIQEAIQDMDPEKKSIILDLHHLKTEYRVILNSHIDDFSFKILCNINRDMELLTMVNAVHYYESEVFKAQLWTLRDIPLPPLNPKERLKEETMATEVILQSLGVNLYLPPSVKLKNSAIRAVWLNYDNFSDYCPSFYIPYYKKTIKDLRITTRREWKKRWELLQSTVEDDNIEEKDESDGYNELNDPKSGVVDVDKIYTELEDEHIRQERKKKGPEALNLSEFEVNLRKYRIVGGIFCIDYLEQPKQDTQITNKKFLRILVYPNHLTRKEFYQAFIPPPPPLPGVRRLPEEIEAEMKYMEKNLERLASTTIQLTDNVLWFEPPIVCRWETTEETELSIVATKKFAEEAYRELQIQPEEIQNQENIEENQDQDETIDEDDDLFEETKLVNSDDENYYQIKESEPRIIKKIQDFNLLDIPSNIDMFSLMNNFIVPRLPDGYGINMENTGKERKSSILRYLENDETVFSEINPLIEKRKSNIKSILYETNSPREYHPKIKYSNKLIIIPSYASSTDSTPSPSDDETANNLKINLTTSTTDVYMLSEFMNDLDELVRSQESKHVKNQIEVEKSDMVDPKPPEKKVEQHRESIVAVTKEDFNPFAGLGNILLSLNQPEVIVEETIIIEEEITSDTDEDDNQNEGESEENAEALERERQGRLRKQNAIGKWSTRDIHDPKFNEDKLTIQFKTGRLGFFGLATNRYSNLPYQTWEIKPDVKQPGDVIFSITASVISIEVSVMSSGVRLNSMQGGPIAPLQSTIGVVMPLQNLIKILQNKAIDLFPDDDAFCYTEGSCEKNNAMESHLYKCMGALALTHNFSWSRWNLLSGSRTAVVLIREIIEGKKIPPQSTLYVTPLKACIVDCTEVSACFSTNGIPGMEYYADLYHLASTHSKPVSKEKQENMCSLLRDNCIQILKATRPISFC